jgi:large subunit ribosomal protein L32
MSVPKRRKTKSRRDQRRTNIFIKPLVLTLCKKCNQPVLPHTVCRHCGFYKGIEVIDVLKKLTKKEKKQKEKEIKAKEIAEKKEKFLSLEELSRK